MLEDRFAELDVQDINSLCGISCNAIDSQSSNGIECKEVKLSEDDVALKLDVVDRVGCIASDIGYVEPMSPLLADGDLIATCEMMSGLESGRGVRQSIPISDHCLLETLGRPIPYKNCITQDARAALIKALMRLAKRTLRKPSLL